MKLSALVFFSAIAAVCAAPPPPPDQPAPLVNKKWFLQHNYLASLVRRASAQSPLDIYFLGDSITEFWPHIAKDLWTQEYGKLRVLNCGVAGDTTQNILYRITNGEFDRISPKVVVILAGINNLGLYPELAPDDLAKAIGRIIQTIQSKSPTTKILVLSIFPASEPTDPVRARIAATNRLISKFHNGNSVIFLDLYNSFLDSKGVFSADISPDGTHLNAKGYQIWADGMRPTLNKLLEAQR